MWPSRMSRNNDLVGDKLFELAEGENRGDAERYAESTWRSTVTYAATILIGSAVVVFAVLWVMELLTRP
jgi:uncharacterized membrane protein YcjF (UPF0283 family)